VNGRLAMAGMDGALCPGNRPGQVLGAFGSAAGAAPVQAFRAALRLPLGQPRRAFAAGAFLVQ
jgi:hypothetical protein